MIHCVKKNVQNVFEIVLSFWFLEMLLKVSLYFKCAYILTMWGNHVLKKERIDTNC